jgi:hypothetical protein
VRAGFVVFAFVHLVGPIVYGVLWLLLPERAGAPSLLERAFGRGEEALRRMRAGDGDERRADVVPRTPNA